MVADIHGLLYGFDSAFVAKDMIEQVLGHSVLIDRYLKSRTLLNVIARKVVTEEKRDFKLPSIQF